MDSLSELCKRAFVNYMPICEADIPHMKRQYDELLSCYHGYKVSHDCAKYMSKYLYDFYSIRTHLVWRLWETSDWRFFSDGFSVWDDWIGFDDWDTGVIFFQILQADFQVQFTGTSNNVFTRFFGENLDHRIGFGQSLETYKILFIKIQMI